MALALSDTILVAISIARTVNQLFSLTVKFMNVKVGLFTVATTSNLNPFNFKTSYFAPTIASQSILKAVPPQSAGAITKFFGSVMIVKFSFETETLLPALIRILALDTIPTGTLQAKFLASDGTLAAIVV